MENKNKIIKSKFLKNVLIVVTGTAGSQLIATLFSPLITRVYAPSEFGLFGTFLAASMIAASAAGGCYSLAIVLPPKKKEAEALISISFFVALCVAILIASSIVFFNLHEYFGFQRDDKWIAVICMILACLLGNAQSCVTQWAIRMAEYKQRSKALLISTSASNFSKIIIGLISPIYLSLVFSQLFGIWLQTILTMRKSFPGMISLFFKKKTYLLILARKYGDFPLYRAPQVILNAVSQNIPIFLFAAFFNSSVVGYYVLARTVMGVPSMLIGQSVADVFLPKFTEIKNSGISGKRIIAKSYTALLLIGFFPYALMFFYGDWVFSLVFGEEWFEAGQFAGWMGIWLLMMLVTRPAISAISVLRLQRFFLIFEISSFFIRVGAIFAGYHFYDSALISLVWFSVSSAFMYFLLAFFVYMKS